jgi:hypothetical protein
MALKNLHARLTSRAQSRLRGSTGFRIHGLRTAPEPVPFVAPWERQYPQEEGIT